MQRLLRRIRGAIGMGFTWAAAWSAVGFVPRWVLGMQGDLPFPILFGGLGFIAGVTFSALVVLTQGRRTFAQMSLPRFAAWGAVGGLLLSALFMNGVLLNWTQVASISTAFALSSAACAAGSLAVARRAVAERRDDSLTALGDPEARGSVGAADQRSHAAPRLGG
ncbi:MAG: hypothetical protein U0132_13590 [Gemmatimonadaceae bacterium]